MEITNNTRLIDLTVGELKEIFESFKSNEEVVISNKEKKLVYGIAGIALTFGCSMTTANRIKASGAIDRAISQCGRQIIVDADYALKLKNLYDMKKNKGKK